MDSSLLLKCEEFLLHPTVRTLSLAQRVDFLEKKGLTPEQITQCLKSVERRNGLSQLAQRTAKHLAADADVKSSAAASQSPLKLLQTVVRKYGVVTLLLALLGLGYAQFRRRKTQQLLLAHEAEKTQRRQRMHTRVEALLAVVKDQQTQYNHAKELLDARVTKFLAAQQAANQTDASKTTSTQFSRGLELQSLQKELLELKSAVVDTYLQPRVVNKIVEVTNELPIVLRPAEATVTDLLLKRSEAVQDKIMSTEHVESANVAAAARKSIKKPLPAAPQKDKCAPDTQSGIRDQTTMSSEEITELFGQVEEKLSTAGSYRVLFATQ